MKTQYISLKIYFLKTVRLFRDTTDSLVIPFRFQFVPTYFRVTETRLNRVLFETSFGLLAFEVAFEKAERERNFVASLRLELASQALSVDVSMVSNKYLKLKHEFSKISLLSESLIALHNYPPYTLSELANDFRFCDHQKPLFVVAVCFAGGDNCQKR